jgi:cyclohexanecarboxylate-CoA ligase
VSAIVTRLTPALADHFTRAGYWPNTTFSATLAQIAATRPEKTAVVDDRQRVSYRALDELATAGAERLAALGVRSGEVVSSLLPNRAEAVALFFAVNRLGAILNPIVPIYGAREIRFILQQTESACVVAADRFRGVDFAALLARLRPDIASLRAVITDAEEMFGKEAGPVASGRWPVRQRHDGVHPNRVSVILYTSGTTAEPKGVLHSDNTLLAECFNTVRYHRLADDEVFVMPSPVSHISGLLYGIMLPVVLGGTSVLMETWDAEQFLALVERERGTYSAGATPFLQGVVESPHLDRYDLRSLRRFPCGGADVPPELIRRAMRLGIRSGRGYGSTEFPSITSSAGPDVPDGKRAETDGAPVPPSEIVLRDADGRPVAAGSEGEIWARGPELCLGYRDPGLNREAFDANGFFRTGDLGVVDADGYLTITGRVKDIIIRRGEKFSAKEIEDLLFEHPKVRAVAVVPIPDPAVGERVCAVVVPARADDPPDLAELGQYLTSRELSRRKLPERLELVAELPTTASGKVMKHVLKERLARTQAQGASNSD